jgi:DMSO/TMAO reductase YedYZ heme-binding membrane subunit
MDPNVIVKKDWQTVIYEEFAKNYKLITRLFHLFYYLLILFYVVTAYFIVARSQYVDFFYQVGRHFGQLAIALLGLVVLPGIMGRFRLEIKLTRLITLFRRQLGIGVFIFAFVHYSFVRLLPTVAGFFELKFPYPALFENLGVIALFILFLMFLTSNNASQKKLGKWWKRLHRFVYLTVWLLVFHTGLQKISIWTLGIGTVAILEVLSFIYEYMRKKSSALNKTGGTASGGSDGNSEHSQNADVSKTA